MEELNTIVLGIRIPQDSFRKVEMQAVNLQGKVENVKFEAIKQTGLSKDQILLVHGGVPLEDSRTLQSYGIRPGVMIHVLKRKEKDNVIAPKALSDKEIQQLAMAFRTFSVNAAFRSTLNRLSRPEVLDNIVMATPGLSQDPVALAIIRDPELLVHLSSEATVRRVVEKHPVLAEAANHIAAAVHEETAAARHARRGEAASSSAFSLDTFSGGEEMDSSQSSDSPPTRATSSGITSSQLAAALAFAGPGVPGGSGGATGSRAAGLDASGLITPEMFNSALQQAFQGITVPNQAAPDGVRGAESPFMLAERMSQQLQQMRELGLRDQVFNLQALQITNGDVQAAIELVMSSAGGGRDDEDFD